MSKFNYFKILFIFFFYVFCFVVIDTLYQFYNYDSANGFKGDILGFKPEGLNARLSGPFRDLIPGAYIARFYFLIVLLFLIITPNIKMNKFNFFFFIMLSLGLSTIYFTGERMALSNNYYGVCYNNIFYKKIKIIFFEHINHIIIVYIY